MNSNQILLVVGEKSGQCKLAFCMPHDLGTEVPLSDIICHEYVSNTGFEVRRAIARLFSSFKKSSHTAKEIIVLNGAYVSQSTNKLTKTNKIQKDFLNILVSTFSSNIPTVVDVTEQDFVL